MRTGIAEMPLHYGRAPAWLFQRMKRLAGAVAEAVVLDEGTEGLLARLSDPHWFQAFGCVLGFDWHSSGLTTTACGALKEGLAGREEELGLFVAGGKGATSRKTPAEIATWGERTGIEPDPLVYASRTSAKVDSAAVQDGYQIYHHVFLFDREALGRCPAGDERDKRHGPPLPLAGREGRGLRVRASRRRVLRRPRRDAQPRRPRQ